MNRFKRTIWILAVLGVALPLAAQRQGRGGDATAPSTASSPSSGGTNHEEGTEGGRREPCWKAAGISPSVMQQIKTLEQNSRSEIASVCSDSSLSAEQQAQKIKAIRNQTHEAIQALFTAQQEAALKACRESHEPAKPAAEGQGPNKTGSSHPQSSSGPCGETAPEGQGSNWSNNSNWSNHSSK